MVSAWSISFEVHVLVSHDSLKSGTRSLENDDPIEDPAWDGKYSDAFKAGAAS